MGRSDSSTQDTAGRRERQARSAPHASSRGRPAMPGNVDSPVHPRVTGPLPGPRSAELLIRQGRRESNARVYPRHIPIAIDEAWGSFVRDLDGIIFIDFLTGA